MYIFLYVCICTSGSHRTVRFAKTDVYIYTYIYSYMYIYIPMCIYIYIHTHRFCRVDI